MIAGLEEITAGELSIGDKVMTLADKIVVLRNGAIEQVGAPLALTVEIVEHLGGETFASARQGRGDVVTMATDDGWALKAGDRIDARFDAAKALLFDGQGRRMR